MSCRRPEPRRPEPEAGGAALRGARRSASERVRLATEIVAAYVRARRTIGRAPIAVVVERLRAAGGISTAPIGGSLALARGLGGAVERTLAYMPGDARCLTRSLVLTQLLARRGMPAKLVIGTRSSPGFAAHAWVELGGQPVLSPGDGSFGRLVEL